MPGLEPEEVLRICHRKVRTLVNRMCGQLDALTDGKQSLERVLIRLTGVLALLRQLRRCDGRAPWSRREGPPSPSNNGSAARKGDVRSVRGRHSLLHLEEVDQDFAQSDDVARLKGLLIWLAWECGVRFRVATPLMESPEDRKDRLLANAIALALLQVIRGDDVVIDEATECISALSTGELDWLKAFLAMASQLETVRSGELLRRYPHMRQRVTWQCRRERLPQSCELFLT